MIALWRFLGEPGRGRFMLALALSGAAGLFGVFLLGLSGWFLTAAALAGASGASYVFNHLYPSAGVRGAAFGRVLSRYGEQLVGHDATLRLSAQLRPQLFESGARTGRGLASMPSAEQSALIDDVDLAERGFLRVFSPAAAVGAGACVALAYAFAADGLSGMLAIAGLGVAGWVLPREATRRSQARVQASADLARAAREDVARLVENAAELDVIGALADRTHAARETLAAHLESVERLEAPYRGLGAVFSLIGGLLALFVLWRSAGGADLAVSAGAALALLAAFDACAALVKAFDAAPQAQRASDRLVDRLNAASAISSPPVEAAETPTSIFPIEAKSLVTAAAEGAPLIGPVSFCIEPGTAVEIIGPSGCGKSTLAEALMKLQPALSGALAYAGVAHDQVRPAHILSKIAIAPQFPAFMPGTLRDQLRLAVPDASDEAIRAVLKIAAADDFVARSPLGLETDFETGEGGFSGGELRRLGLARALLVDPQLLILDEPFAGLDAPLAESLARSLTDWALAGDRALALLQHQPAEFMFEGLKRVLVKLPPI